MDSPKVNHTCATRHLLEPAPQSFAPTAYGVASFDSSDSRYRCCCESLPARVGCWVVGSAELMFMSLLLLDALIAYLVGGGDANQQVTVKLVVIAASWGLTCGCVAALFHGLRLRSEQFVFLHIAFQVFRIIAFVIAGIILVFALADEITRNSPEEQKLASLMHIFGAIAALVVEIWLFAVVLSYYRFLQDSRAFESSPARKSRRNSIDVV